MPRQKTSLNPRKKPVQARSTHTVETIFEACIQVLLNGGAERLTTTRVAERAGVSVGTLYQYYGDKRSLLAAVLERHLLQVVEAVEAAAGASCNQPVHVMVEALVNAFFAAKMNRPDISKALYAIAAELDGQDLVLRLTQRSQLAIVQLLASASDARFDDPITASFVVTTALVGPVQALLAVDAPVEFQERVRQQLVLAAVSYLRTIANEA